MVSMGAAWYKNTRQEVIILWVTQAGFLGFDIPSNSSHTLFQNYQQKTEEYGPKTCPGCRIKGMCVRSFH